MQSTLKEIAECVQGRLLGDGTTLVEGIGSIQTASAKDLVFVEDVENLDAALNSAAAAVIAGEFAKGAVAKKPLLICSQPRLAFARAAKVLCPVQIRQGRIHPNASVSTTAKLGKNVSVDACAVVSDGTEIGDNTRIGANSVIGTKVKIGSDCELYPNVTVYAGARLGNRVIVHAGAVLGSDGFGYVRDKTTGHYEKFPQIGGLEIEDDVEIGANTTIDRGALAVTRIARGVKIDNLVHVGHNVRIGEDVVIAAQTGFSGSITVEKDAVIGGQVGIGEQATIGEGVMLGGQSGVLPKKILRGKGVAFWGTPAKPLRKYLEELAALGKLTRKSKG
jgi:UDP-3-O-[3-hydroxymyristoyl] glucosamine N-acyltransferase